GRSGTPGGHSRAGRLRPARSHVRRGRDPAGVGRRAPSRRRPRAVGAEMAIAVPALEMRGITKRYPGVLANDHINLDLRPGEIHALLGENGAGKSTLMNILYGLAVPDEGEILLDGAAVAITGPSDAIARGISMVHQHFMLVPVLTVAENILLGHTLYAVLEIADRITVIRRGRVVGTRIPKETNEDDLAEMMVGREVQLTVDRGESHPTEPALKVEGLRVADDRGHEAVKGV